MLPAITIVMTTYFPPGAVGDARLDSAALALRSWRMLKYAGPIALHIADDTPHDASWQYGVARLSEVWRDWASMAGEAICALPVTVSHQTQCGVGASLNAGFRQAWERSPLALYAVDDWALTQAFDLTPCVKLLVRDESFGIVRLGPPHPDLTGTVKHIPEGWTLRLDPHHFAFATRPALYHQRFIDRVGTFLEGVDAYAVEWEYNHRWQKSGGTPHIAYALPDFWEHVGTVEVGDLKPQVAETIAA